MKPALSSSTSDSGHSSQPGVVDSCVSLHLQEVRPDDHNGPSALLTYESKDLKWVILGIEVPGEILQEAGSSL